MADRDVYEVLHVSPRAHAVVIRAAYRALAALYHPDRDGSEVSQRRMAELNAAYAEVRTPERREIYDRTRQRQFSAQGTHQAAAGAKPVKHGKDTLDFGRYEGWTILQLAREDPDYLRWLSRHSSGIRYRQQIQEALQEPIRPTASERMRGK